MASSRYVVGEPLSHNVQFTKGQDYFIAEQIKHTRKSYKRKMSSGHDIEQS